jgi:hypothetical protein
MRKYGNVSKLSAPDVSTVMTLTGRSDPKQEIRSALKKHCTLNNNIVMADWLSLPREKSGSVIIMQ